MKLFNLDQYLLDTNHYNFFKILKYRKTYDWIALQLLCGLFNYTYSIQDTIYNVKNKRIKYDLIKLEKLRTYSDLSKINKFIKPETLIHFFKKLFPEVEIKTITRTYKYAPEQKETFYAFRTI